MRPVKMLLLLSLTVAMAPAQADPPTKTEAEALARTMLSVLPAPPAGWRIGKAPLYPDRAVAADQGAALRWRYVAETARFYIRGGGPAAQHIQVTLRYVPKGWIAKKRRQLRFFQSRAPHCVSQPEIGSAEAYLMGTFGTRTGNLKTCTPGARLTVLVGQVIVTLTTGQNVGRAGLSLARAIDWKALAAVGGTPEPAPGGQEGKNRKPADSKTGPQ